MGKPSYLKLERVSMHKWDETSFRSNKKWAVVWLKSWKMLNHRFLEQIFAIKITKISIKSIMNLSSIILSLSQSERRANKTQII